MGIVYAGMGVGGAVCPFIIDGLLKRYSYKTTMISIGIGFGIIGLISLIPIRRRIPPTSRSHHSGNRWNAADWSFMKSTALMTGLATILLTSLGNFVPSLWLPCTSHLLICEALIHRNLSSFRRRFEPHET